MDIRLAIDIDRKELVWSQTNGERVSLPTLQRDDSPNLIITLLRRNTTGGKVSNPFTVVDIDNVSLRVGIGARSGNLAGTPIAAQTTWEKDLINNTFTGVLALDTAAAREMIDQSASGEIQSWFEVKASEGGEWYVVYQKQVTMTGDVLRAGSLDPAAADDLSAFSDAIASILTDTDTITWTQDGTDILGVTKLNPAGGLTSSAAGVAADFGTTAGTVAEGDTVHDPVTVISDVVQDEVPTMDAATTSGVTVSASHEDTGTEAWKAFDDDEGTAWQTPSLDESLGQDETWIMVDFGAATLIRGYMLEDAGGTTSGGITTLFQGSDDAVNFTTLNKVDDTLTWNTPVDAENFESYRYYRLVFQYAAGTGVYTSRLPDVRLFDHLPSVHHDLAEQQLYSRVKIDPNGGLIDGVNGLRRNEPSSTGQAVGGVIYSASAPDVSDTSIPYPLWIDTSNGPQRIRLKGYNAAKGTWEEFNNQTDRGLLVIGSTVPDVATYPELKRYGWLNTTLQPPSLSFWDEGTQAWIPQCNICSGGAGEYPAQLPSPTFSPSSGSVPVDVSMSVVGHPDALIYYTTDGSDPDATDTLYSTPVNLAAATTLKAIAIKGGWLDSNITTQDYGEEVVTAWLANINFRGTGAVERGDGGAATFDSEFADQWNNFPAPSSPTPGYAFIGADGVSVPLTMTLTSWVASNSFNHSTITDHPDDMMATFLYSQDSFDRDPIFFLDLPAGVYDVYAYGHGPGAAGDAAYFRALDDYGESATENTEVSGTDYLTNAWVEGEQYVLFEDLEPLRSAPSGITEYVLGAISLYIKGANPNRRLNGLQIRKKNQLPKVKFTPKAGSSFFGSQNVQLYVPDYNTPDILYYTGTDVTVGAMKTACRVATTADITLSGEQTIDGVAAVTGDRVLVKDQSTGSENGIYVCAAGAWSRATDADEDSEMQGGIWVKITEGTANADTFWLLTTSGSIALGSTSLTFSAFSIYSAPLALAATTTIQATAHLDGIDPSTPRSGTFTKL